MANVGADRPCLLCTTTSSSPLPFYLSTQSNNLRVHPRHNRLRTPRPQPNSSYRPNPDENGIYRVGNGVIAPAVIYSVEPQFSEQARKRKVAVDMFVEFIVDSDGHTYDFLITKTYVRSNASKRDLAAIHSLEPKAIETVRQYRFKPATFHGKPFPCHMWVEISFESL